MEHTIEWRIAKVEKERAWQITHRLIRLSDIVGFEICHSDGFKTYFPLMKNGERLYGVRDNECIELVAQWANYKEQ
jgi:hypothetical protein